MNRLHKRRMKRLHVAQAHVVAMTELRATIEVLQNVIARREHTISLQAQQIATLRAALEQHPFMRWDRQDREDENAV